MRNIIRTIFSLLAALLLCLAASGQSKVVHVTLKNGTTLSGYLKEIDPASHLVVDIAGIDTRIEMDKVASVQAEELAMTPLTVPEDDSFSEELDVPDSFTLRIGETEVEMVLIRGGDFLMGFDGRYSMDYRSEPIHPVRLNSFYVSKSPLTNGQVTDATGRKQLLAAFSGVFTSQSWSRANDQPHGSRVGQGACHPPMGYSRECHLCQSRWVPQRCFSLRQDRSSGIGV